MAIDIDTPMTESTFERPDSNDRTESRHFTSQVRELERQLPPEDRKRDWEDASRTGVQAGKLPSVEVFEGTDEKAAMGTSRASESGADRGSGAQDKDTDSWTAKLADEFEAEIQGARHAAAVKEEVGFHVKSMENTEATLTGLGKPMEVKDPAFMTTEDAKGVINAVVYPNGGYCFINRDSDGKANEIYIQREKGAPVGHWRKEGNSWTEYDFDGAKTGVHMDEIEVSPQGKTTFRRGSREISVDPDGSTTQSPCDGAKSITHNARGLVTEVVYPNGDKRTIEYNEHDNPQKITRQDGTYIESQNGDWSMYDPTGKKIGQVDAEVIIDKTGTILTQHPNGEQTWIRPDGLTTRRVRAK